MLKVRTYPLGPIQTNCYIIYSEDGQCLIIDPGDEGARLIRKLKKLELTPLAVMLTHAHFDHIGAVDSIRDYYGIPVYIHTEEKEWLGDPALNGSARYPGLPEIRIANADHLITEEKVMEIGPFQFEMKYTPGHSPGSVSYIFKEEGFAVVGDTLFSQSVGRTDLPGGNTKELLHAIHDKLLVLEDEVTIYPGHGPSTTVGYEKDSNPYLNGF